MKRTIIQVLESLYTFRTSRLFLLPSEARAAMQEAQQIERDALAEAELAARQQRLRFATALRQLPAIKFDTRKPFYEVRVSIPMQALETAAGDAAAISIVAMEVAERLVKRHRKEAV